MPHEVNAVQGEAPNVPVDRLAQLEAKLATVTSDAGKMQKVLNRLQSIETRLAALEAHATSPAKKH